ASIYYSRLTPFCDFLLCTKLARTVFYTLSLHDALPICSQHGRLFILRTCKWHDRAKYYSRWWFDYELIKLQLSFNFLKQLNVIRSEEHTSELQSRFEIVCRLLHEKKKTKKITTNAWNN